MEGDGQVKYFIYPIGEKYNKLNKIFTNLSDRYS